MKAPDPGESDLRKISEEFRSLSRITNSIYFQSAMIRKDVKFREFLSDLLRIDSEKFNLIIDVDTETAILELKRMVNEYKNHGYLKNKNSGYLKPANLKTDMERMKMMAAIINETDFLIEVEKIPDDILFKEFHSIEDSGVIKGSCSGLNHSVIYEFLNLFKRNYKLPENDEIARIMNSIHDSELEKVRKCLPNLVEIQKKIDSLSIWKANEKYEKMMEVRDILLDFIDNKDSIINYANNQFDKMKELFEKTKPLWMIPKSFKTFENLKNSAKSMKEHESDRSRFIPIHTSGFRNSEDLMKVKYDLESSWFQKNIVRGGNTTDLFKSTESFRGLSKSILEIEKSWNQFMDTEYSRPFLVNTETLELISKISENYSSFQKLFVDSKNALRSCKLQESKFEYDEYAIYEREQQTTIDVLRRLDVVRNEIIQLKSNFFKGNNQASEDLEYTDDMLDQYSQMTSNVNSKTALQTRGRIFRFLANYDEKFEVLETMKAVAIISIEMENLKESVKKLNTTRSVTMKSLLKKDNFIGIFKCLREKNFDALKVRDSIESLHAIHDFPKRIEKIYQYLNDLSQVKNNLSSIEKNIENMNLSLKINGSNPVLLLKNPRLITENIGICTEVLENLEDARQNRSIILNIPQFSTEAENIIMEQRLFEWTDPRNRLENMIKSADDLNEMAKKLRNETISNMTKIFDEAAKIYGINGRREQIVKTRMKFRYSGDNRAAEEYFRDVREFDLEFSKHQARLKNAHLTVSSLNSFFDEIFGHNKRKNEKLIVREPPKIIWISVLFGCIGFMIFILFIILLVYGLTENGKNKYQMIWLYYFGKTKDFEKRWRYSLFMDYSNGRNSILDAVREGNKTNLMKAVKNGAYINVYNKFGNTALHVATKLGHPDLVDILIRNGADRTLLNSENRTPEQTVCLKNDPENQEQHDKIQSIYRKCQNRKYRNRVPQKFPESSYHIWIDDDAEINLTNQFMQKFQAIVIRQLAPLLANKRCFQNSDEPKTSTHCVVKTDGDGVLVTENMELLTFVFNGIIIMKEKWMTDCLNDPKLIIQDSKYLVEKVKYKGTIYETVLEWSNSMAKGAIPYLHGAYVAVVMDKYDNLLTLTSIVDAHGGIMMEQFPMKKFFNKGSHPYLHSNLGPLFLIHDGTIDLSHYQNDPDKMYTLFTEEEFIVFMLKRDIHKDMRENPIPVLKEIKK